jgi:succinate dehydrogenase / fumarate reductase cytochrome b subunit
MNVLCRIWNSSIGKKYLMAGSGLVLVLFVVGHMIGNLQIFLGPEAINRYAHFLQSNVELLWPVRVVMLSLVCLHIVSAVRLWQENKAARPVDYEHGQAPFGSTLASRMMLVGGAVAGCFIVFHLLHYTVRLEGVNLGAGNFHDLKEVLKNGEIRADVFAMMVAGFNVWHVSLFYVIGVGLLCYHLSHGIAALVQSLGLREFFSATCVEKAAKLVAIVLFVGYISIPTSVLLGYGKEHLKKSAEISHMLKETEIMKANPVKYRQGQPQK